MSALLEHGDWTQLGMFSSICGVDTKIGDAASLSLAILAWAMMVLAMMLPSATPLLRHAMETSVNQKLKLIALAASLGGYLISWIAFGFFTHFLGHVLNELISVSLWWSLNSWILGTTILAAAGFYQLTAAKAHFLRLCCKTEHDGQNCLKVPSENVVSCSFMHGLHYGFRSVKCCGLLMMLMFVMPSGNLLIMALLMILMLVERSNVIGISMARPIGFGLLAIAAFTIPPNLI